MAAGGGSAYVYYWTYPSAVKNLGACHTVELAYIFNNPGQTIHTGGSINTELAAAAQKMWVNFAKTGNPSTDEYEWKRYDAENQYTMVLGDRIYSESGLLSEQRESIRPLLKYRMNGCNQSLPLIVPLVYRIVMASVAVISGIIVGGILTKSIIRKKK